MRRRGSPSRPAVTRKEKEKNEHPRQQVVRPSPRPTPPPAPRRESGWRTSEQWRISGPTAWSGWQLQAFLPLAVAVRKPAGRAQDRGSEAKFAPEDSELFRFRPKKEGLPTLRGWQVGASFAARGGTECRAKAWKFRERQCRNSRSCWGCFGRGWPFQTQQKAGGRGGDKSETVRR